MNIRPWLDRPIAHRGLHDAGSGIVENTETAFQRAIDRGFGIELDIQEAGDGEALVFHDYTLDRLTQTTGAVREKSASELKQARYAHTTDRMQTLAELLEQVADEVPLFIEIKSDWQRRDSFERRVMEILKPYKGRAAVMSFDPASMSACRHYGPALPRGLVADAFTDMASWGHLDALKRFRLRHLLDSFIVRPNFVNYDINALPSLAPTLWKRIAGKPLLTWTIRSRDQMKHASQLADAVIFEGFMPE